MSERWKRLDQVFSEALQTPADARFDWASRACGEDEGLRTELLSLLAAAEESGEFMARPALEQLARAVASEGWTLRPGDRVGAYTVERLIGSGVNGEVWRARDERLGRDVALKTLLPYFTTDADRLRRFEDEARAAGALNHPNVLTVYDVDEHRGVPLLISEFLEGQSLRERLQAGPLPIGRARGIALQVAQGLAAAHARGIVHRDLKPENVFLRSDGGVKLLDFGVAKLQPATSVETPTGPGSTATGVIVGTVGYMAPEQIRGGPADTRVDLFALGVTLFEMLSGARPFEGSSAMETLHAILNLDPPDLRQVRADVPRALADVVGRLLEKAPEARFQSAADLAWALRSLGELEELPAAGQPAPRAKSGRSTRRVSLWAPVALLLPLAATAAWWMGARVTPDATLTPATRFVWSLPAGTALVSEPAVSPDGRRIAYVGAEGQSQRIFVRDLAALDSRTIAGTDGAKQPFWSPDARSIGYFANGRLMKVAVDGGPPVSICAAPDARGGTWSRAGVIVFQGTFRDAGLSQVPAGGGPVRPATLLDVSGPDGSHRWPAFLPDGVHFLYTVASVEEARRAVHVASLSAPPAVPSAPLFPSTSGALYVPAPGERTGYVLSAADRWIEARPFDPERLAVTGEVRKLDLPAVGATPHHPALLSVSGETLAFASSPVPFGAHVAAITRGSRDLEVWPDAEITGYFRVSPEGRRLARTRLDPVRLVAKVWVDDLARRTRLRITHSRDIDVLPVWSPDGRRIAYRSGPNSAPRLEIAGADGSGPVQALSCPRPYCEPTDWSGDQLIVNVSGGDVWAVPTEAGVAPHPVLAEEYAERDARVSPDGRWIAYVSDESGGPQVSVRSLDGPPRRFAVSSGPSDQPVWRRDGLELFYTDELGRLYGVPVRSVPPANLVIGAPRALGVPTLGERHWGTQYDVSPDGRRIYFPHPGDERPPHELQLVLGWRSLLR